MSNDKYTKALAELKVILKNSEDTIIEKIPKKFIMFIENNYDKEYSCSIKSDIPINNQNVLDETKYLMALVYRSYLCDENERQEYDKILRKNEDNYQKELHKKYDINIFENRRQEVKIRENINLPVVAKKENLFKRIIKRIKNMFTNGG